MAELRPNPSMLFQVNPTYTPQVPSGMPPTGPQMPLESAGAIPGFMQPMMPPQAPQTLQELARQRVMERMRERFSRLSPGFIESANISRGRELEESDLLPAMSGEMRRMRAEDRIARRRAEREAKRAEASRARDEAMLVSRARKALRNRRLRPDDRRYYQDVLAMIADRRRMEAAGGIYGIGR